MTDPNMPGVHTDLGPIKPDTKKVAYEVVAAARAAGHPLYFVWGTGDSGDHLHGIAIDFMVYDDGTVKYPGRERPEVGRWVREYLWTNRKRLGVRYLIFDRQIISVTGTPPNVELPYYAIINGKRDPHTNHVHCSLLANAPAYEPPEKERPPDGAHPKYHGWNWPAKGWCHVSVKGDKYPWVNGRSKPSTKTGRIFKNRVRKDGFNIFYVGAPVYRGGHYWVKTRFGTWYQIANDLVLGKKAK